MDLQLARRSEPRSEIWVTEDLLPASRHVAHGSGLDGHGLVTAQAEDVDEPKQVLAMSGTREGNPMFNDLTEEALSSHVAKGFLSRCQILPFTWKQAMARCCHVAVIKSMSKTFKGSLPSPQAMQRVS